MTRLIHIIECLNDCQCRPFAWLTHLPFIPRILSTWVKPIGATARQHSHSLHAPRIGQVELDAQNLHQGVHAAQIQSCFCLLVRWPRKDLTWHVKKSVHGGWTRQGLSFTVMQRDMCVPKFCLCIGQFVALQGLRADRNAEPMFGRFTIACPLFEKHQVMWAGASFPLSDTSMAWYDQRE